jgi:hypothetical protein
MSVLLQSLEKPTVFISGGLKTGRKTTFEFQLGRTSAATGLNATSFVVLNVEVARMICVSGEAVVGKVWTWKEKGTSRSLTFEVVGVSESGTDVGWAALMASKITALKAAAGAVAVGT